MILVWLFVHRFELRPSHVEGSVLWLKKLLGLKSEYGKLSASFRLATPEFSLATREA